MQKKSSDDSTAIENIENKIKKGNFLRNKVSCILTQNYLFFFYPTVFPLKSFIFQSKKPFENFEIENSTELPPCTPEDPFHTSSSEDSLFSPSSDKVSNFYNQILFITILFQIFNTKILHRFRFGRRS